MKIDSVQKNSNPASIPANSTPLRPVSFRGDAPEDTVEISAEAKEKKAKDVAEGIKENIKDAKDVTSTVADNTGEITDNVAKIGKDVTGMFASISLLFSKIVPDSVKDFFAPKAEGIKKIQNEAGEFIEQKVLVRKPDMKHIKQAGAVVAAVVVAGIVFKAIKNKVAEKKAQKAQQA